jgi:hypothetical protein
MSRPWIKTPKKPPERGRDVHNITLNELWDLNDKKLRRERV